VAYLQNDHLPIQRMHAVPTLFPYTTLFRSQQAQRGEAVAAGGEEVGVAVRHPAGEVLPPERGECLLDLSPGWLGRRGLRLRFGQDRKSTRLNSSHVKISYAVFCLQQKRTCK